MSVFSLLLAFSTTGISWTWRLLSALIASYLVPAVANLHNATTDVTEDSYHLSNRVLAVRRLGSTRVTVVLVSSTGVLALLLAATSLATLAVAPVGIGLMYMYSMPPFRLKSQPLAGACTFALVAALPYIGGSLVSNRWATIGGSQLRLWPTALLALVMCGKFFIKNLPDFDADKRAGLKATATIFTSYRNAAVTAVLFEAGAYVAASVYVFASTASTLKIIMHWVVLLLCVGHATSFVRTFDALALNARMKWDMLATTLFVASWAFPAEAGYHMNLWLLSMLGLATAMIVPLDSRAGWYISRTSERHEQQS